MLLVGFLLNPLTLLIDTNEPPKVMHKSSQRSNLNNTGSEALESTVTANLNHDFDHFKRPQNLYTVEVI